MSKVEIVEMTHPKLSVKNAWKVPLKQWRKWSQRGRMVFNYTFAVMRPSQTVMTHPKAPKLPKPQWQTVAWNAAWIAADGATAIDQGA